MKYVRLIKVIILLGLVIKSFSLLSKKSFSLNKSSQPFSHNTGMNDAGGGSIFYMDRHNVKCDPGSVLQGFHYIRGGSNQFMYEYNCLTHSSVDKQTNNQKTNFDETASDERSSTNYLDRHDVKCPTGQGLNSFHMIRQPDASNRIAYEYTCSPIKTEKCATGELPWQDGDGSGGERPTYYLDRQVLSLSNLDVLTAFKLVSKYNGDRISYKYQYSFCTLSKDAPADKEKTEQKKPQFPLKTQENDDGDGSIFYLDRHELKCPAGQALQGFHFTRPQPHKIMYEYGCLKDEGINQKEIEQLKTKFADTNSDEKNSANYLDRHDVRCPSGKAIAGFKLIRKPENSNEIAYEYSCVPITFEKCDKKETLPQDADDKDGTKFTFYLDRLILMLEGRDVLTAFKLETQYYDGKRGRYKYIYEYCTLKDPEKKDTSKAIAPPSPPGKTDKPGITPTGKTDKPVNTPPGKTDKPGTLNPPNDTSNKEEFDSKRSKKYKKTDEVDYNKGSLLSLTKLKLECQAGEALQTFKLKTNKDKVFYKFKCIKNSNIENDSTKIRRFQTPFEKLSKDDGISVDDLKFHCSKCPENYALQSLFLKTDPADPTKISYEFNCVPLINPSCRVVDASPIIFKTQESNELAGLKLTSKSNDVLRSFKLVTNGEQKYSYHVEYCSLK